MRCVVTITITFVCISLCDIPEEMAGLDLEKLFNSAVKNKSNEKIMKHFSEINYLPHIHHLEHIGMDEKENSNEVWDTFINTTTTAKRNTITVTTTENGQVTQHTPKKSTGKELSVEEIKMRKRMADIEKIAEGPITSKLDFANGADDSSIITRRFDDIHAYSRTTTMPPRNALREMYYGHEYSDRIWLRKRRTMNLMAQFIYATRYKLPHSQTLRKKYNKLTKYKIGYCFSLLRNLKREQRFIFTTIHYYHHTFTNLFPHLKLYEKLIRIDVDIKDVIKYIRELERERRLEENPKFYDYDSAE